MANKDGGYAMTCENIVFECEDSLQMKAVAVLIFGLSILYNRACLHIGQNIDIHKINIIAMAIISRSMLNLCIAFTKYIRALEMSTHELYFIFTSQFMK